MEKIRILVVDDHPVVREGFRAMLSTDRAVEVVGEACDGVEAVTMVAEKKPNVILMDVRMPNMDGIEATHRIKEKYPETAVIILTMYDNDAYVIDTIRAGASGYLLKDTSRELLLHTVHTVISGVTLFKTSLLYEAISSLLSPKEVRQKVKASTTSELWTLTPRELDVLRLVADGRSNKDIGKELSIAEDTVKKHMQSIIAKLDASGRLDAAMKATRAGIVG